MTRRDSEVDVNDAEGDRSSNGGCTSREASASSSSNEKSLGEKNTRKGSKVLDDESKLMVRQDRLVISEAGGKDIEKIVNDERKEKKDEYRDSTNILEAVDSEESVRQSFCKKMDNCLAQVMEATVACGPVSSTTINAAIFTSASGSSTPICDTRLPASILFELPDSCGTSNTESTDKMPAITKAQMKEFEEAFNLFDKDRDGSITKEELGRVMRGLGQFARTEELRTMLEEIDTDGDGNVSLVEFVKIVSNIGSANAAAPTDLSQEEQEEQELRDAFRVFDKHNRGYITASDLRAVLQCLGEDLSEEEIEDMIKEVDEDGDGRIDFYEFARSLVEPGTDDEDEDDDEEELPQSP